MTKKDLQFPFYEHFHVPAAGVQNGFSTLLWELITGMFTGKFLMFHPECVFPPSARTT